MRWSSNYSKKKKNVNANVFSFKTNTNAILCADIIKTGKETSP